MVRSMDIQGSWAGRRGGEEEREEEMREIGG